MSIPLLGELLHGEPLLPRWSLIGVEMGSWLWEPIHRLTLHLWLLQKDTLRQSYFLSEVWSKNLLEGPAQKHGGWGEAEILRKPSSSGTKRSSVRIIGMNICRFQILETEQPFSSRVPKTRCYCNSNHFLFFFNESPYSKLPFLELANASESVFLIATKAELKQSFALRVMV